MYPTGYPGNQQQQQQPQQQQQQQQQGNSSPPANRAQQSPIHQPYKHQQEYTGGVVRALFIGINYVGQRCELDGCQQDIKTWLATLERIAFPIDECVIMTDDPDFETSTGAPVLYPSRANILHMLSWLVHDLQKGDTLWLHVSGHGTQQKEAVQGEEEDGMDECIVPVDFQSLPEGQKYITDNEIFDIVCRPMPPGTRLTFICDTCHAGSMSDLMWEFAADAVDESVYTSGKNLFRKVGKKETGGGDVVLVSGSQDDQTSADSQKMNFDLALSPKQKAEMKAGGAMSCAFCEILNTTGGLTFAQILIKMRQNLKKRNYTQNPCLSATRPIDLNKPFSLFGTLETSTFSNYVASNVQWQAPVTRPPVAAQVNVSSLPGRNQGHQWTPPSQMHVLTPAQMQLRRQQFLMQQQQQQQQQQQHAGGTVQPQATVQQQSGAQHVNMQQYHQPAMQQQQHPSHNQNPYSQNPPVQQQQHHHHHHQQHHHHAPTQQHVPSTTGYPGASSSGSSTAAKCKNAQLGCPCDGYGGSSSNACCRSCKPGSVCQGRYHIYAK